MHCRHALQACTAGLRHTALCSFPPGVAPSPPACPPALPLQLLPDLHRRTLVLKDTQQPAVQPLVQQAQQGQQGQRAQQGQQSGRTRLVHYHYSAWPDHGVPASPQPLLRLCEELRAAVQHSGPVLVHCSGVAEGHPRDEQGWVWTDAGAACCLA